MSRYEARGAWEALLPTAVASLAVLFSQFPQAAMAADDAADEGRIVSISPDGSPAAPQAGVDETPVETKPTYWIGLAGGPITDPVLRTHLQLADDVGVAVQAVVPGSPAEKAGLKKHDVLIAVNGEAISEMPMLQKVVLDNGAKPIELKLIRIGKEMTITVTPEIRPADVKVPQGEAGFGMGGVGPGGNGNFNVEVPMGDVEDMLKQFQNGAGMRMFGPGMVMNGAQTSAAQLPGGVSISVTREGEGPAKVAVKQGDKSWEFNSDDKEAISKLPDDVRPFVEQMTTGQRPGALMFNQSGLGDDFQLRLQQGADQLREQARQQVAAARHQAEAAREQTEHASDRLLERMQKMEERLQEMQKRLEKEAPAAAPSHEPAADDSST